jgi:ribosome biogenesis GTPase / thiamine phosphate phosphatase
MIDSMDLGALRAIGLSHAVVGQALGQPASPGDRLMRVTAVQRDLFTLHDGHQPQPARLWPSLRVTLDVHHDSLVVGDWVLARPSDTEVAWISARVPPLTLLQRRDSSGRRQPLAANVDLALLVMTCGADFNLRRLDRYLALVRLAGVEPVVVLTKADLHPAPEARLAELQRHVGEGLPAVAVDGQSEQALAALSPWLQPGRTLVLLGSSGAGKSTLTNTLIRPLDAAVWQDTGGVRADDERGRHTTTHRSLHRCAGGACVIDTPGLRGLQLDATAAELDSAFEDITELAGQCRFRDCRHGDEPGCAVRAAVAPARLQSYHKLQREAGRDQMDWLARRELLAEWKARGRQARVVARAKRPGG